MRRFQRLVVLGLAVLATASSCSGAASGGSEAEDNAADDAPVELAEVSGSVGDDEDVIVAALEGQWEQARSRVVDRIRLLQHGVDDDTLIGPAGFEIDLDDCPSQWSDVGASTDDIVIGLTLPQSGRLAPFESVAAGMAAYFEYVNVEHGGIDGRQLRLEVVDDGYDPEQTMEAVEAFIEADETFAVTTLGSPSSLAVYEELNDACVPHPFVMSPHPAWGDPDRSPWTTGLQMSYSTEAVLWGSWIRENLEDELPVVVAALGLDNDDGRTYSDAFAAWAEENPNVVEEFVLVPHDGTVASVAEEMAEVTEADPDVYISMTFGDACVEALLEAEETGLAESVQVMFMPSVCRDLDSYVRPAGVSADQVMIVDGGWRLTTDPHESNDPYIGWVNRVLDDAGLDSSDGLQGIGFAQYGWVYVEALRIAAELDGGLTRPNLILAIRSLDIEHPLTQPGVAFAAEGSRDAFLVEGSGFARFDLVYDGWVEEGRVIDADGLTPTCRWDGRRCR